MWKTFNLILLVWIFLIHSFTNALKFPPNFIFGASSGAYQIEGAWNAEGKGENIWDRYTHTMPNAIKDKSNGDVSANSYYLYGKDIKTFKEIGLEAYRLSISWARILPDGHRTRINHAGIAHYNRLIDELLKNGIQPIVMMYHWDLPQKLQNIGGWANSSIVDYMEQYADILFSTYGNRVKWWLTLNEPIHAIQGYYSGQNAPALNLGTPYDYITTHYMLLAHARVFRLYEKKYRSQQNGKVSLTLNYDYCTPKTSKPQDKEATERYFQFMVGIFAHPIFSKKGDYPELVRKMVNEHSRQEGRAESRLPYFTEKEKQELLGSADYFAINHYTTFLCSSPPNRYTSTGEFTIPFSQDMKVKQEINPKWPASNNPQFKVVPWGFRKALIEIKNEYNNPPILVTENGFADQGQLNDWQRVSFFREYLKELLNAVYQHNCNVLGYMAWTALDDFEWSSGYSLKFGLIHVDFKSPKKTRILKCSAFFFKSLIKNRKIP